MLEEFEHAPYGHNIFLAHVAVASVLQPTPLPLSFPFL